VEIASVGICIFCSIVGSIVCSGPIYAQESKEKNSPKWVPVHVRVKIGNLLNSMYPEERREGWRLLKETCEIRGKYTLKKWYTLVRGSWRHSLRSFADSTAALTADEIIEIINKRIERGEYVSPLERDMIKTNPDDQRFPLWPEEDEEKDESNDSDDMEFNPLDDYPYPKKMG